MNKQILLTVDEVCKLENVTHRALRMKITRGSIDAIKINTNRGCGFEYRIDLQELSEAAKVKYYAKMKNYNTSNEREIKHITDDNLYKNEKNEL